MASIHSSLQLAHTSGLITLHTKIHTSERPIALLIKYINSPKIHQERQQEERQAAGTGWTDSDLAFTTPKGKPLDPTNLTRRFYRLLRSAGIRTIRFTTLDTRQPGDHRDGQRRQRRTATLHRPRPLTLPSTTAVTPC
ncbi:hypothetical protein ACFP51_15355 [Streptomyces pratens]|uniref:Uncharacterized protein n=1 Tax=Streptomyces pratens TaxID=887456 RepID=A0ABW1M5K4_9ACTN